MKVRHVRGSRLIAAVNDTVWMILPEKLQQIAHLLTLRADGDVLSADEIQAVVAARPNRQQKVAGAVAVLPLTGTLLHRANALEESSGVQSLERWSGMFDALVADDAIGTIILDIESPGGSVYGVDETAAKVFAARKTKRVIAVANSLMASAAYYIGSAATEVVASPSALVGSIGTVHLHLDFSRMADEAGITPTYTVYGEHKAEAAELKPLSDRAREHLQEMVTMYGQQFELAVARHRGVSVKHVREQFGAGRVFNAAPAAKIGLVDRVATLDEILAKLGVGPAVSQPAAVSIVLAGSEPAAEGAAAGEAVSGPDAAEGAAPAADDAPQNAAPRAEESAMPESTAAPGGAMDAVAAERARAASVYTLCADAGIAPATAAAWVAQGMSVDAVNAFLAESRTRENGPISTPRPAIEMSEKENRGYSVARAILAAANGRFFDQPSLELEVHDELVRKFQSHTSNRADQQAATLGSRGGIIVPTHLGLPRGARPEPGAVLRTTPGSAAGEHFVFTEPGSFIDLLRSRIVTVAMGATFLPGLQGNVSFPKQTGAGNFVWRDENPGSDVALSDLRTGQVGLQPRNGTSATSFSRQLLAQSVINVEQLVRRDLASIAARGIDLAALHGATGGSNPVGLYHTTGVNVVAFNGPITYAGVVEMETAIVAENADIGSMGYVTTPEIRGQAKVTQMFAGTNGAPLWTGGVADGEMNGHRAMASNQVAKTLGAGADEHGLLFGVWEHLLIGEWGAMEILVDPYTRARQALIEVVVFLLADVAVRYPEAFSRATGLRLSS